MLSELDLRGHLDNMDTKKIKNPILDELEEEIRKLNGWESDSKLRLP